MQYFARVTKEGRRKLITFPDCPGCQTFVEPREDAYEVAREALEGWLEVHLEDGEAPPRPSLRLKKGRGARVLGVRIDPTIAVRLGIRWARQAAGLSQGELADRLGVTRQQVSLLESNGRNLTVGTLRRIADALGRDVEIEFPVRETAA